MEFFPSTLSSEQSDTLLDNIFDHFQLHKFGLWATVRKDTQEFIGFVGLQQTSFEAAFTPCVEIAWRIASDHQRQGFATEASKMVLDLAFELFHLDEVVSFTVPANKPSMKVMKRIGLSAIPSNDFEHPSLPEGHELRHHVFFALKKQSRKRM